MGSIEHWYFPNALLNPQGLNGRLNMEDTKLEKKEGDLDTTITPEETPETPETPEKEEGKDIDFEKELESLESGDKKPERNELEKAKRSLHFNAERVKELGGDPSEILGKPKTDEKQGDVDSIIDSKFAERDARARAKSESEFKVIMWYVKNKGLSVDDAHMLANKGKILRSTSEFRRSQVDYSKDAGSGQKILRDEIPARSAQEVALLNRRGMQYDPKTKTYRGKYTEEYFDQTQKKWLTRKI